MGKKIGIIAFICAIVFIILAIIGITQAPEIPDEVYELMVKDQELAQEKMMEAMLENSSNLYKIVDTSIGVVGLAGIVLSIVALVKMIKGKEKGKVFPILAIVFIVIFYFVYIFSVADVGKAFEAGFRYAMESAE